MPKLLVLFYGAESPAATLAESAAHGARHVRFTEVDVRAGGAHEANTGQRYRQLASADQVGEYAGVVLACPTVGDVPADLDQLLTDLERTPGDSFANTVFGVAGGENTVLLGRVSRLGGIIVSEPRGASDPEARARMLGQRVAKVSEWVRHSLSHEATGHSH